VKISADVHKKKKMVVKALEDDRLPHWTHWRDIADYVCPSRYVHLLSPQERLRRTARSSYILDGTGTLAARTCASGMMNGITSPSRPWFKLNIAGFSSDTSSPARIWLDEVRRRMLLAMAETNFYNAMAVLYLDLVNFASAAVLIYEDYDNVFRCYNSPLGEFYFRQNDKQVIDGFAREFNQKVFQMQQWWGEENFTETTKAMWTEGGARRYQDIGIVHLIEPNIKEDDLFMPGGFAFRELYWEAHANDGTILAKNGFNEMPGIFPRWELTANDSYGSNCPAMIALGDIIQLQHETKKKGQGLDKLISPPVVADIQLQHKPTALLPNGVTYVMGQNNQGIRAAYQIQLPLDQLTADIREVQARVRETFHNDLFQMISQLETVRSATEIDARREEKLVLLGPVLERFENEALDPAIKRIYAIMDRAGLIPPPPPDIAGKPIEIQYVSVLTSAQTAVSTIPTERWVGLIGSIAPIAPNVVNIPDWNELVRSYGQDLGVEAKLMLTREATDQINNQQNQQRQVQQGVEMAAPIAEAGKLLSETEVGGGASALQRLINPYDRPTVQ
jgi:hypothetical protein